MSDLDLTPEAVERLCQMLLAVDKSRHGYTGHPRYNRDGMQAEQVIRALSERLAEVKAALATARADALREAALIAELVEAATEVGRISDRDHVAWHRLSAALAKLNGDK
jgi:hypothetical protein